MDKNIGQEGLNEPSRPIEEACEGYTEKRRGLGIFIYAYARKICGLSILFYGFTERKCGLGASVRCFAGFVCGATEAMGAAKESGLAHFFTFAPELVIRYSTVWTVGLKREPGENPGLCPQL